jgi:FAD binding domain-containing protein
MSSTCEYRSGIPGWKNLFRSRVHGTTLSRLRETLEVDDDEAAALSRLLAEQPDLSDDRHIVLETLLTLRGRIGTIVVPRSSRGNMADPSIALYLSHLGLPVVEVDDYSEVEFPSGKVIATPFIGEHADLDIQAKSTYCVRLRGRTIFVGADSSGIDPGLYRYIRSQVGQVNTAFLGMECAAAPLIERSEFDQILLDHARHTGVDVREQHAVSDVTEDEGRVRGVSYTDAAGNEGTIRARYVVDASGNRSRVYQRTGATRQYSEFFRSLALFSWFWYIPPRRQTRHRGPVRTDPGVRRVLRVPRVVLRHARRGELVLLVR